MVWKNLRVLAKLWWQLLMRRYRLHLVRLLLLLSLRLEVLRLLLVWVLQCQRRQMVQGRVLRYMRLLLLLLLLSRWMLLLMLLQSRVRACQSHHGQSAKLVRGRRRRRPCGGC